MSQDRFLCRAVAIALKVTGVILVLLSMTTFFMAGRKIFDLSNNAILGGMLFELIFVIAVYAATHVLFIRAQQIENVASGPFIALRFAPFLICGLAEAYAALVGLVAIGGGIFVWFTNVGLDEVLNPAMHPLFPNVGDDPSFVGGIGFLLSGVAVASAVLLIAYMLAELVQLLMRSVKAIEPVRASAEERFRSRVG